MKTRIHLVAGARPNFMKVGPLYHALAATDWAEPVLVHTGQHFSPEMSDVFLRDLGLPDPAFHLRASGKTHAEQTAAVLTAYEALCLSDRPDWTVVVGDVNSTLAAALVARKLNLPVAHLEAGLRSGDRTMPEEINRVATDAIADLLWTPSADADVNLRREGIPEARIELVGNVMIDAYCQLANHIAAVATARSMGLEPRSYVVVTLHRPVNVDTAASLTTIAEQLVALAGTTTVVFPVHPRTRNRLEEFGLWQRLVAAGVRLIEPLGYIEFMSLVTDCALVVTDSGGIQEETTYLGIPCLTARESTERPVTVELGSNRLISPTAIAAEAIATLSRGTERMACRVPLWDGQASSRIVRSLRQRCSLQP
ncbi:non-hydrolyzing UDP-N-acetylglucosamine 2-epimerase [Sulfurisoma sediminicola]|uniref:UDP-N-acetylglucosamine 2-epimerase (Non-hydrolysing) n=1 Tax=Sulfurisoma sediminicola TaxID=1381557 RepID=A0A497XJ89_9PROT|nr:UDP-N-acetylglucosamine 2-epimerase (non-hydrolyzing) [Sulfurisoma sediminicola]RLJ67993.1 UDP-N-acetylglucosamine 2-epimerase (non-hydrolysing) [Sulfurisoma sediminicola]